MDSFFGIGPLELIFILIFALIFLGPERLPGAVRQIAGFIRQIQKLSSTLTQQMGEEFGDIRELDPRYQLQQMMDEPDEKEAAKKAEEKKKEEEKKKAEAKKAEEKRQAEAKKKAEEAKKTAEAARAAVAAKAAAKQSSEAPTVSAADSQENVALPLADENTQVISTATVKASGDQVVGGQETGGDVENSIAPPTYANHAGGEGTMNGAADGLAVVTHQADEIVDGIVAKEEQA